MDVANREIQVAILRLHWEKGKLNRTAVALQDLRFTNYVKRIFRTKLLT